MRRLWLVVAAAMASATIALAVVALDAVGADSRTATTKQALARKAAGKPDVDRLTACLRAHGVQPPSAATELKRWIVEHGSDPAVANALKQCGTHPPPNCG
jgi:hypothetical protein